MVIRDQAQTLRRARIRALENGTSVNAVVSDYLQQYAGLSQTRSAFAGLPHRHHGLGVRRAVALGPELGTVGPELIRDAAKESSCQRRCGRPLEPRLYCGYEDGCFRAR